MTEAELMQLLAAITPPDEAAHAAGKQLAQPQCRTVQLNRYRSLQP